MNSLITSTGIIGLLLLAGCGIPQAVKSWRQGHSRGMSPVFLLSWLFGEVATFIYVLFSDPLLLLLLNYAFNIVVILVILKFYYFERR